MFKKILVPLDGSALSVQALPAVQRRLVRPEGLAAEIPGQDADVVGEIPRELDEAAMTRLDEIFPGPGGAAPEAYAW